MPANQLHRKIISREFDQLTDKGKKSELISCTRVLLSEVGAAISELNSKLQKKEHYGYSEFRRLLYGYNNGFSSLYSFEREVKGLKKCISNSPNIADAMSHVLNKKSKIFSKEPIDVCAIPTELLCREIKACYPNVRDKLAVFITDVQLEIGRSDPILEDYACISSELFREAVRFETLYHAVFPKDNNTASQALQTLQEISGTFIDRLFDCGVISLEEFNDLLVSPPKELSPALRFEKKDNKLKRSSHQDSGVSTTVAYPYTTQQPVAQVPGW